MDRVEDTAGVIAPPPLIALAVVLVGLLLDWLVPAYVLVVLLNLRERVTIGAILVLAGAAMVLSGLRALRAAGTAPEPWKPSARLVTGGIYRYLRNPMYVGGWAILAGVGMALGSDWTLVMLVLSMPLLHFGVVMREERYLERRFADAYRAYKARVPRYGWPF